MYFADALTLDGTRRTADGYLVTRAKAARVGVYDYLAGEPSIKDALPKGHSFKPSDTVKVLRDTETVFDPRSAHSFIGKPVTDDHPTEAVTADNWREHSRGVVMGAKWEEGGYLSFDLMLTDADAIAKVEAGKRELSNGYSATLEFGDFTAPDGTKCHARQTAITGNHVAIVDRGRAGSTCRIGDAAVCSSIPLPTLNDTAENAITWLKKAIALHKKHMDGTAPTTGAAGEKSQMLMMTQMEKALAELEPGSGGKTMKMDHFNDGVRPVKTMLIDGLTVDIANADTAQATITTILAARDAANAKVTGLETQVAAKDTEIATLKTEKKALEDAKPTPAQLRDAAKAYALTAGKAKSLGVEVTDAMDESQIMAATVKAKMGDAAKDWSADQIAASFAVLAKDAKVQDAPRDMLRDAISGGLAVVTDSKTAVSNARAAWLADKQGAHRGRAA